MDAQQQQDAGVQQQEQQQHMQQQPQQDPGRGKVRVRPEDEKEPAVWRRDPDDASSPLVEPQQVRLRSTTSSDESIITFVNLSSEAVRAVWIDFAGNEVQYTVIEASTKRRYRTYQSHPWIVRSTSTGERLMLNDSMVIISDKAEMEVQITTPPLLPWTLKAHQHFPREFKHVTRQLLLCHHRASHAAHAPSIPSAGATPMDIDPPAAPAPVKRSLWGSEPANTTPGASDLAAAANNAAANNAAAVSASTLDLTLQAYHQCFEKMKAEAAAHHDALLLAGAPRDSLRSAAAPPPHGSSSSSSDGGCGGGGSKAPSTTLSRVTSSTATDFDAMLESSSSLLPLPPAHAPMAVDGGAAAAAHRAAPPPAATPRGAFAAHGFNGLAEAHAGVAARGAVARVSPPLAASPRALTRAARSALGWVVDKVVKVTRSPMRPPRPAPASGGATLAGAAHPIFSLLLAAAPHSGYAADGAAVPRSSGGAEEPLCLRHLGRLPAHLVVDIIALLAPEVRQCITRGPAGAHPDIQPALLPSDPATWAPHTPPEEMVVVPAPPPLA